MVKLVCVVSLPASSIVVHSAITSDKGTASGRFGVGLVGIDEKRSGESGGVAIRCVTRYLTMLPKSSTRLLPRAYLRRRLVMSCHWVESWAIGILARCQLGHGATEHYILTYRKPVVPWKLAIACTRLMTPLLRWAGTRSDPLSRQPARRVRSNTRTNSKLQISPYVFDQNIAVIAS